DHQGRGGVGRRSQRGDAGLHELSVLGVGAGGGLVDFQSFKSGRRVDRRDGVGPGDNALVGGSGLDAVGSGGFIEEEETQLRGLGGVGLGAQGRREKGEAQGAGEDDKYPGRRTKRLRRSATGSACGLDVGSDETTRSFRYEMGGVHMSSGLSQRKLTI